MAVLVYVFFSGFVCIWKLEILSQFATCSVQPGLAFAMGGLMVFLLLVGARSDKETHVQLQRVEARGSSLKKRSEFLDPD